MDFVDREAPPVGATSLAALKLCPMPLREWETQVLHAHLHPGKGMGRNCGCREAVLTAGGVVAWGGAMESAWTPGRLDAWTPGRPAMTGRGMAVATVAGIPVFPNPHAA